MVLLDHNVCSAFNRRYSSVVDTEKTLVTVVYSYLRPRDRRRLLNSLHVFGSEELSLCDPETSVAERRTEALSGGPVSVGRGCGLGRVGLRRRIHCP